MTTPRKDQPVTPDDLHNALHAAEAEHKARRQGKRGDAIDLAIRDALVEVLERNERKAARAAAGRVAAKARREAAE